MPQKNNPFHIWLGLDASITNPNHFQLLGVSPKLDEQAEIEAAVGAGVERSRAALSQVPPGKFDQALAKVKSRIANAEQTLLDPTLREQYKKKIQSKTAASKLAPSQTPVGQPGRQQDLSPPTRPSEANLQSENVGGNNAPILPAAPVVPLATPLATPVAAPPQSKAPLKAVPLAVPMNVQPKTVPVATTPMATPPPATDSGALDGGSLGHGFAPKLGAVAIKKSAARRRSKLLGPIMAMLMLGAGIGGALLLYQNFDEVAQLLGKNETRDNETLKAKKEQPFESEKRKTGRNDSSDEKTEPLEKVATNSKTDLAPIAETKQPEQNLYAEPVASSTNLNSDANPDPVVDIIGAEPENNALATATNDSEAVKPKTDVSEVDVAPPDGPEVKFLEVSLDEVQLASVRRDMQRAYRSLYRREKDKAFACYSMASQVLKKAKQSDDASVSTEQQLMVTQIEDFEKMASLLEGFWDQVHKSADSISGAQEIVIGTQIVGFVESTPESVIVRRSGSNIEYFYSFCPPGLAVAIAELGAIQDVPTWNMQKAAFYSIDQLGGLDHTRRIEEFLTEAESAGHQCDDIRRLGNLGFDGLGRPEQKVEMPRKNKLDPAMLEYRKQHGYRSPRQLDGPMAYQLAEELFQRDAPTAQLRVAMLEEARQLAIQGGAASLAEDAIFELDILAEIDRAELYCDSFTEICNKKLEPLQVRQLMERAIGFLNSSGSEKAKAKDRTSLKERLLKLSERYGMLDAFRRLGQVEI